MKVQLKQNGEGNSALVRISPLKQLNGFRLKLVLDYALKSWREFNLVHFLQVCSSKSVEKKP
jgi:hypothetical protein